MTPRALSGLSAAVAFAGIVHAKPGGAQSLAERVAAVGDGAVSFSYSARPGVCGDGEHFIRTGRSSYHGSFRGGWSTEPCNPGPVQVRVTVQDGAVARVQYWVGARRDRSARDLGIVAAPEAARWLMTVAAHGSGRASAKAIMPAVLADSAVVWPALLDVAKDTDTRPRATRIEALQWLAQYAGGALAGRPNDPLDADEERDADDDLKAHAVFVLSQLPRGEGIPDLLKVARSNDASPYVRRHAFFWLAQSGDERVIPVLEAVLRS